MSGRFPGAGNIDAFWELIVGGRSAIREVDRFASAPWFDGERGRPGRAYAKWGGFLDEADRFDPGFFRITPAEAEVMDPQQRVLLEEAWRALEDAGLPPDRLSGRPCGVFVGASANNYSAPAAPSLQTLGASMAILSARISYFLNLRGPAFPIDTGCSSSLVALHLACRSLIERECDTALAAGVSVNLISPEIFLYLCDSGMASPTGRCRTFDDGADGFVPGEGVGVLVLKRLEDALVDGDRIDAVILGTGVNQDGRTSGLTAPSAASQTALEVEIYRRHGIDPRPITLIEAHGTGTPLGDPIEIAALTDAFREFTDERGFCAIGSVKTNIGHAMSAAGVAGVIKAALALRERTLPPSLNFSQANRHIDFAGSPFFVSTGARPWEPRGPRRAAVSSFGFSGTNAHVVLEEAPAAARGTAAPGPWLFALSAKTKAALRRRAEGLVDWLAEHPGADLEQAARTLLLGRTHFRHRAAFVAGGHAELLRGLRLWLEGRTTPTVRGPLGDAVGAYLAGEAVDAQALFPGHRLPARLPTYPFERERYWAFAPASAPSRPHPLIDREVDGAFETVLETSHPLLRDHRVRGWAILPGVAVLELMRAAAELKLGRPISGLHDVTWTAPVTAEDGNAVRLRTVVEEEGQGGAVSVTVKGASGTLHASARLPGMSEPETALPAAGQPDMAVEATLGGEELYARLGEAGFAYGAGLRAVRKLEIGTGGVEADLALPPEAEASGYGLVPALLDGALQAAAGLGSGTAQGGTTNVPFSLDRVELVRPLVGPCRATASLISRPGDPVVRFDIILRDASGATLVLLQGLTARPLAAPSSTASRTLFYETRWEAKAGTPGPGSASTVLLFADGSAAEPWRRALAGRRLVEVESGGFMQRLGPDQFSIDPDNPADYATLLEEVAPEEAVDVVLLGSAAVADGWTLAGAMASLDPRPVLGPLAQIARLLAKAGRDGSRIAVACPAPASRAAAAFCRSLMSEAPALRCRVVEAVQATPEQVVVELLLDDGTLVRHEGGQRLVAGLAAVEPTRSATDLRPGGVHLLTGGLGGLGLLFARHLAETVPGVRLCLLGRSAPTDEAAARLSELEALGAEVLFVSADVGDPGAMRQALGTVRRQLGPLNGVLHMAGVLRDAFVQAVEPADLDAVCRPKTKGAIILDHLTRDDDLDLFVLFSSTAAELGVPGQGAYAAANGFLDGFAVWREEARARGERRGASLSINWPLWEAGGMTPDEAVRDALDRVAGIRPMPAALGLEAFDAARSLGCAQVTVLHGDCGRLRTFVAAGAGLGRAASPTPATVPSGGGLSVEDYLRGILNRISKLPVERIDTEETFDSFGIDSMMAVRLTGAMEEDLGPLPKTLFFEHRNLAELSDRLRRTHGEALGRQLAAAAPGASAPEPMPPFAAVVPTEASSVRPAVEAVDRIAIIGVSGIYPMAPDLDAFWANLEAGRDCITEIPPERWPLAGFYDPDRSNPRTSYGKWGGFIEGADCFDARFFKIAPLEAETIDPQARKFMEVAWATVEDAGYTRESLLADDPARRAGVFVGVMYGDYQLFGPEEAARGGLIGPNAAYWNIANRVSWLMDFRGPSMAIDTACSSSLSAIHMACASLRAGDCGVAIAGGVNLSVHPSKYWTLSKAGMLSSDGRCRSFGEGGDGYVPGEGIGALLLKPLKKALADGDHVYGVILGSSVNHGGRTNGYTVPTHRRRASWSPRRSAGAESRPRTSAISRRTAPAHPWATRSSSRALRRRSPAQAREAAASAR